MPWSLRTLPWVIWLPHRIPTCNTHAAFAASGASLTQTLHAVGIVSKIPCTHLTALHNPLGIHCLHDPLMYSTFASPAPLVVRLKLRPHHCFFQKSTLRKFKVEPDKCRRMTLQVCQCR